MGFFGPRRIACDDNGEATQFPIVIEDNEYSILDITDLVFIDPVGTGYSKPLEGAELAHFIGYENDNRTVGDFIRLYVTRYGRWSSPKYLSGESYGTIRAIGLGKYLSEKYALGLNGIMLVSSINDFTTMMEGTASDYTYALYLPTYAADAWYHGKLALLRRCDLLPGESSYLRCLRDVGWRRRSRRKLLRASPRTRGSMKRMF